MSSLDSLVIKKNVSIPKKIGDKNVMALIEIGSKVFGSKDQIYQKFFELGYDNVKNAIMDEIMKIGGDEITYSKLLMEALKKVDSDK